MNGEAEPHVKGTSGILQAYQKAIHGTKLAGPTYFSDFLKKIQVECIKNVESVSLQNNRVYSVLIIITDGNCHDMEITKSLMVDLSRLPFSAVVVGVGDSEFEDMEILDADTAGLTDKLSREAARDIV